MTTVACVCYGIPQTVLHASEMSMQHVLLSEVFLFVVFGVAVVLLVS